MVGVKMISTTSLRRRVHSTHGGMAMVVQGGKKVKLFGQPFAFTRETVMRSIIDEAVPTKKLLQFFPEVLFERQSKTDWKTEMESCVPPGFRFHPTEEELVGYYLKRKINSQNFDLDVIADIDLYKIEPWDIQANCKLGYEEQKEWYFFSHKDKKYPTGTRTNRATAAGFWKATGRDKAVLSKNRLIGMRKTLVFYRGRAPNGSKTDWIMHEYSLHTTQHELHQEEGWVVCRAFKKPSPNQAQGFDSAWRHSYFLKGHTHFVSSPSFSDTMITAHIRNDPQCSNFNQSFEDQQEILIQKDEILGNEIAELPNFDSPTISTLNNEDVWGRNSYFNWKDVDHLLATKPAEMEPLSHPNLVTISQNCDPESHYQRMIFRNFPNL